MSPILVSIIIPCYNVEDYVGECLDSAINQTYRPIEIIAVDNNSTDKTLDILRDYERRYPDLITVLEKKKQGAPAARNKGMSVASGEWLQFLDADDLLMERKIANQVNLIEGSPDAWMVVGTHIYQYLGGQEVILYPDEGNVFKAALKSDLGYTVSNLFRKVGENLQPIWNINLNGAQDTNFIFDYIKTFGQKVIYDKSICTITRERPSGQITRSNPILFFESCIQFHLSAIAYLKKSHLNFYENNELIILDNLYYVIYSASLANIKFGYKKLKELLPFDYYPDYKRENRITFIHSIGFMWLGFSNYVKLRKFLMKKFCI